jgi:hypothetical protein
MIDGLTGPPVSERRLRDLSLRTAVVVLLSAIGLGFGTFAAYDSLRSSQGPTIAALIVAATYGLLAIASWALARHRPDPTGPTSVTADVAAAPLLSGNVGSMLQLLTVSARPEERLALDAAMRLARDLSPMQLAVLSLVAGFMVGRNLGK